MTTNPYLEDGESETEMLMHRAWAEGYKAGQGAGNDEREYCGLTHRRHGEPLTVLVRGEHATTHERIVVYRMKNGYLGIGEERLFDEVTRPASVKP